MDTAKILIVEDEETLCEALQFNLEAEGYEADIALSAEQALTMNPENYSLILLDVMMGEMSGFKMAKILKADPKTAHIPIIFCTAKDTEDDMVGGLNLGADDYITKPYSIRNVLARIRSVLRRAQRETEKTTTVTYEGIQIDYEFKRCIVDGEEVKLTKKEMEILLLLITHRGHIFSREEILEKVWKNEVIVLDRTVDVNITRLRQKIGPYGQHIITRSGYGYGFQ